MDEQRTVGVSRPIAGAGSPRPCVSGRATAVLGQAESDGRTPVLAGQALENSGRKMNVTEGKLSEWRDKVPLGAESALREREWDIHRHLMDTEHLPHRRSGPQGPMDDARLMAHVRRMIEASLFHGEGYRKVWARIRFAGIWTSQRRVLRLMWEKSQLALHRLRKARVKMHTGMVTTDHVDTRWARAWPRP